MFVEERQNTIVSLVNEKGKVRDVYKRQEGFSSAMR